jgi:hypothetical protein
MTPIQTKQMAEISGRVCKMRRIIRRQRTQRTDGDVSVPLK